jgi:hypothetical protein
MGYGYDRNNRLCCDNCGMSGGVRKRTCPYTVLGDSLRSVGGQRYKMSYCYPPALCAACYATLGGLRGVHGDQCREGAARSQAEYDEIERGLEAGEMYVVSAEGSHAGNDLPRGLVRVTFRGRAGETKLVMLKDAYQFRTKPRLSDYQADALIPA